MAPAAAFAIRCGIEHHFDHALVEEIVEVRLQLQLQRGRRDRHLLRRRQQFAVEFVGDVDEMPRGLARGRAVAGQRLVGMAEQAMRMGRDRGRAEGFQQFGGDRPAARGIADVVAERMAGVGFGDDRVEFAPRLGEIVLRISHQRQRGAAARPLRQEHLLHFRPAS